jgi:hypothetical protein
MNAVDYSSPEYSTAVSYRLPKLRRVPCPDCGKPVDTYATSNFVRCDKCKQEAKRKQQADFRERNPDRCKAYQERNRAKLHACEMGESPRIGHPGDRNGETMMTVIQDASDPAYAYRPGARLFRAELRSQAKAGWIADGSMFRDQDGELWTVKGRKLELR